MHSFCSRRYVVCLPPGRLWSDGYIHWKHEWTISMKKFNFLVYNGRKCITLACFNLNIFPQWEASKWVLPSMVKTKYKIPVRDNRQHVLYTTTSIHFRCAHKSATYQVLPTQRDWHLLKTISGVASTSKCQSTQSYLRS